MSARRLTRALAALALLAAPWAAAWTPPLTEAMLRDARRIVPKSLARLIAERERQVLDEMRRFPADLSQALARDLSQGQLRPETLQAFDAWASEPVQLLREQQVGLGVIKLAALLRIPADLSDPAVTGGPPGYPAGVAREYYAFVEGSLSRLPVTLEDPRALSLPRRDLPRYWAGLYERSKAQAPVLRAELYRRGRLVDHRMIDYRNPVFGVAQISYSRAVTAIGATWSALWREARGDMTRVPRAREVEPQDRGPVVPDGLPPGLEDEGPPEPRPPQAAWKQP